MEDPDMNVDFERSHFMPNVRTSISNHRWHIAIGATVLSAVNAAFGPVHEAIDGLKDNAPYVGAGVLASEAMFIVGAAIMAGSVGAKIGNPFNKGKIDEIYRKANSSRAFKAGFIINTLGAVGDFFAIAPAVVSSLKPSSWGILALPLMDLGLTYKVRKMMMDRVKNFTKEE